MNRIEQLRELDARAWSEGRASGIVPDLGGVAIEKFTAKYGKRAGQSRRYYALSGNVITRKELLRRARRLDAKEGLENLLAKCLREGQAELENQS